ncbi:carbohydrate-binding module family 18 protein [Piromyces sp. E2]|nr:carbohydrate-binding module family 18 protein [Piromyces sp. E2]|eukprot:OUM63398.1 carbohydrate-binding module family 18 protein [Piromyces sp. E2]
MKILNIISLLLCTIAFLEVNGAKDYEITHYGCYDKECLPLNKKNKDKHGCDSKCHSMDNPSCYKDEEEAFGGGRNQYFSAISTHIADNYKIYCKDYAIVMLLTGEKKPLMVKTRIVDSCSRCPKYHLDLGQVTFEKLLPLNKGIANVIWGIYTEDGTEKKLIYDKSNSKSKETAKAFGVSLDELAKAFSTTASALAKSSKYETNISLIGGSSQPTKTTTKKSSTKPTSLPTSRDKCGPGVAVCADPYCCSQYGWCGSSSDHCKRGCQKGYGKCKN